MHIFGKIAVLWTNPMLADRTRVLLVQVYV